MARARVRNLRRITRELRFRLTAGYALFFSVLLISVAILFRVSLSSTLDSQVRAVLDQEWAAMKGYLRIEGNEAYWYYDPEDPDENRIVSNIQQVYLITGENGVPIPRRDGTLSISPAYHDIGIDSPALIRERMRKALAAEKRDAPAEVFWEERWNSHGAAFLIRAGIVFAEGHGSPHYVAIGASLARNNTVLRKFTLFYAGVIPAALILASFLGWFMAGRALTPVLAVAQTAQRISGSNLSLRIPTRHAGDELDYLILTFNRMIERLEATFQQMKQFSADVSHELRTPITGMRGQLEVALFTAKTTDQYREAMFNALQDIDRLSQIVRALLLLSQAESGQLVLQKSRVNLGELVEDVVEQFQIPAEAAGLRLTAAVAPECCVDGDRVQIERMLTNLLSNAVKFTPEGGDVRVLVQPESKNVAILVEDTGRGIPAEHVPHIFDRFYRVPGLGTAPGPEQGLGLGLSFVSWIVKAHRGTIEVDSTPGKGTRFTILIPAAGALSDTVELAREAAARAES